MDIKIDGYKTYLIALAMVCYAILGMAAGWINGSVGLPIIMNGLALAGLRHGVQKVLNTPDQ